MGELTIKTPERRHSVLQFQSLSFLKSRNEVQAAKLVISDYKHNTTGRPFPSLFTENRPVHFCPVEFLLRWCRMRGSNSGPLFCLADGSAVKTEVFTRQLKGALAFCDLDCSSYKSRTLFASVQLVWQQKTACLTRRFGVLVVGNLMHLSYTYDRQLCGQIRFVFGYCSHGLVTCL